MNALHITAGVVAVSALIAAVILAIPEPSNPITIEPSTPGFEDAWKDTSVPLALAPPLVMSFTRTVKTEVVTPEVITPEVSNAASNGEQTADTRTHHPEHDICRGKGKRYTHNGKSWRCRR